MNRTTLSLAIGLSFVIFANTLRAQSELGLPDRSQAAMVQQRLGVTDITIRYHRPLVDGRKIWGDLVPFGKVWRAGANLNTTIEVSDPVSVEGKPLPQGIYGLQTIPTADSWTIIFSKAADSWGSYTYNQAEDALRVTVKPRASEMIEALQFTFEDLQPQAATVAMRWDKLAVPFRISVTDEQTILPYIRRQLRGFKQYFWGPPNEAAQYCLEKKIDLPEALKWADLSIQAEERFENLGTKADLLKAMGKPDEAKVVWKHALEIAKPDQLYTYARQLQGKKRDAEAMEIFQLVAQQSPQGLYGHMAQARIKSAAGDYAGAAEEVKQALAGTPDGAQKQAIKALLDKLNAQQDINK
jgi:predicted negative regulator of RcsB-dependent stress response